MPYIEFKITDKTFFKLSPEEITAKLNERAKAQMDLERTNQWSSAGQQISKFPRWLRTLLRGVADDHGTKLKWSADNDTYSVRVGGDLNDADDFYADFGAALTAAIAADKVAAEWSADNHIGCSISESDGESEMADLENHNRGARKEAPPEPEEVSEEEAIAETLGQGEENEGVA